MKNEVIIKKPNLDTVKNITTKNFKITYIIHILFPLNNTNLN